MRSACVLSLVAMLGGCPSSRIVDRDASGSDAGRDREDAGSGEDAGGYRDACPPIGESCDGTDNDCDSLVDEDPESLCPAPQATATCEAGECVIAECEGYFADCNGLAADGCEVDLANDVANCRECGRACGAGESCAAGLCDPERFVRMSSGLDHQCAVRADGGVMCWGWNRDGKLGDGTRDSAPSPVLVEGVDDAVAVAATSGLSCAVTSAGTMLCWNEGPPDFVEAGVHAVPAPAPFVDVALGAIDYQAVCGVTGAGEVLCAARNDYSGIFGTRAPCGCHRSALEPIAGVVGARSLGFTVRIFCALDDAGSLTCWGRGMDPDAGFPAPAPLVLPAPVAQVASGMGIHQCAVLESGDVWCWGNNVGGPITLPGASEFVPPTRIEGLPEAASSVAVGFVLSCAVLEGGTVACWGTNDFGAAGREPGPAPAVAEPPTVVPGVEGVVQVGLTMTRGAALHASGAATAWGTFPPDRSYHAPEPLWGLP